MSTATPNARATVVMAVRRRCRLRFRHASRSRNFASPPLRGVPLGCKGAAVNTSGEIEATAGYRWPAGAAESCSAARVSSPVMRPSCNRTNRSAWSITMAS